MADDLYSFDEDAIKKGLEDGSLVGRDFHINGISITAAEALHELRSIVGDKPFTMQQIDLALIAIIIRKSLKENLNGDPNHHRR